MRRLKKPCLGFHLKFFLITLFVTLACPILIYSASDFKSLSALRDPERAGLVLEQAKKEGRLNLYTVVSLTISKPVANAFEKKYGIPVSLTRSSSDRLLARFSTEAKAGVIQADIMENDPAELTWLAMQGFLEPLSSPQLERYPKNIVAFDRLWAGSRYTFYVLGYNTSLIFPRNIPKTYEDLLNPRWKGKMMIEAEDVDWFATLWNHWGEQKASADFKKLGEQDLLVRRGHTNMSQLLAAGEAPLAITLYNHQIEKLKQAGAPVEWFPIEPVVARLGGASMVKNAPHPAAALLYFDFIFSVEGQNVLRSLGRSSTDPEVGSEPRRLSEGFKFIMVNPQLMVDKRKEFTTLFQNMLKNQ
jgi:iron(III) transport system substrate-binding protein